MGLAPWAKKETSPVKEAGQGMTLQEIQRMEAERERKERQQRDLQDARLREEQRKLEEEERARRPGLRRKGKKESLLPGQSAPRTRDLPIPLPSGEEPRPTCPGQARLLPTPPPLHRLGPMETPGLLPMAKLLLQLLPLLDFGTLWFLSSQL